MLCILALCVAVAGRLGADPPTPPGLPHPLLPWRDLEEYRNSELDIARSRLAYMEEMTEFYEQWLNHPKRRLTPEKAARERYEIQGHRAQTEFLRRYKLEFELWGEQAKANPGSETDRVALERIGKLLKEETAWDKAWKAGRIAPMPREVKR